MLGNDNLKCQALRNNLAALEGGKDNAIALGEKTSVWEHTRAEIINPYIKLTKSAFKRHRVLRKLGWRQKGA